MSRKKKNRVCHVPFVWAGPGRAETSEKLMGRAVKNGKYDGLGLAAAHPLKI